MDFNAKKAAVVIGTLLFALHFRVTYGYALTGYPQAQHQVGQRYLHGKGVPTDEKRAMENFKKASDQVHLYPDYNLAIGHMKGYKTGLKPGKASDQVHLHPDYNLAIGHMKGYKTGLKPGFRKASDQGHPHAAYNLAIGHMKGYKTGLKPGDAHQLIVHAASKGVREAHRVLNEVCARGGCKN